MSNKTIPATATPDNFYWIMSDSKFMYTPTRSLFERPAVQRQIGKEEASLVERDRVCSNLTWIPGLPTIVRDKVIIEGELEDFPGNNLFNWYKPPRPLPDDADPAQAQFWLDLGFTLFGDDLPHTLDWLAWKTQHPDIKINHALVLGSYEQGIGKDSWLSPVRRGIGPSNWRNVSASHALTGIEKNFTPFLRASIARISEAHEMGVKRFAFYDATKDWCAAPPETLTIADKNVKEFPIMNAVGVIFTTNHKTDGLYIPPEDRRLYYAWSPRTQADFSEAFWRDYWDRVKGGADKHVAAYLMARDLSAFDPGRPPPKTPAWHEAVAANRNPQDNDLTDLLDKTGDDWIFACEPSRADALTLDQLRQNPDCPRSLHELFSDAAKRRTAAHRLETAGYSSINNPDRKDGQWRIDGKSQTIYARRELPHADQLSAARALVEFEEFKATLSTARKEDEEEFTP